MNCKCLLIAFGLFFTKTLADSLSSELKPHELDDYDVTTIYKLRVNGSVKCSRPDKLLDGVVLPSDCYYVVINSRTNSIGMPIHYNGRVLSLKKNDLEYIVDEYYSNDFLTKNYVEYDSKNVDLRRMDRGFRPIKEYLNGGEQRIHPAGGIIMNSYYDTLFYLKISWTPSKTIKGCIALTYYIDGNDQDANVKIFKKDNNIPMVSYKINTSSGLNTVVLRTNDVFVKNKTYILNITSSPTLVYKIFGIKRIAQCSSK
ncbi:uncharacterized protein LOC126843291 [Adelges cooleyi]|uniref:uncharacterized protein LOC126843291 n=1 Tax=Adelges cooleyi TaxID=133065 RepID=UPI00217F486D|nr:uncharacterized protein LOC126843291 [Adelges cooleyi]